MPLVLKNHPVPEVDPPSGRWPHTSGQDLSVTYRYLGELNDTSHRWRIAFVGGASSWNSSATPITLYLYSQSQNTIGMVDDASEPVGYTVWYVSNGELLWVEVNGNYYWEDIFDWTTNQRRSIMAHEAGHLQGIGHIPRSYPVPALMYEGRTNDEREIYYFPQSPDILLVNQIYP